MHSSTKTNQLSNLMEFGFIWSDVLVWDSLLLYDLKWQTCYSILSFHSLPLDWLDKKKCYRKFVNKGKYNLIHKIELHWQSWPFDIFNDIQKITF